MDGGHGLLTLIEETIRRTAEGNRFVTKDEAWPVRCSVVFGGRQSGWADAG
jgi:hypothetical protein